MRLEKKNVRLLYNLRAFLLLLPLFLIPLYAEAMRAAITRGIRLCATTIIPSIFPFMVLSSLILHFSVTDSIGFLARPFTRLFHIGEGGLCAFLCGTLCGFPLGAKCAVEAYQSHKISKDECERLIAFSSNASPAFLIAGVGALRSNMREGVALYFLMIFSSILIGFLMGRKKCASQSFQGETDTEFSFTLTIENAGLQTLFVCSYLLFFSALIGVFELLFANIPLLFSFFLPWLEIGSSCAMLARAPITPQLSLSLTALSVSFGGLSVHLQTAGLLRGSGISMKQYCYAKLLQGVLSFALSLILF